MRDRRPISLGERWRREANRGAEDPVLEQALATLPQVRHPHIRILGGSIRAEMEGVMGAINEVSIHAPTLPGKIWPQVARVMRRSKSMLEALSQGRVPRSFDRLVARIGGESVFPEARRVSSACTCGALEMPWAGNCLRSTLPFGVSGNASMRMKPAGTMYSGKSSRRRVRNTSSSGISSAPAGVM